MGTLSLEYQTRISCKISGEPPELGKRSSYGEIKV